MAVSVKSGSSESFQNQVIVNLIQHRAAKSGDAF